MNLPTELLRTFVEVIDAGSMLQASERVCVTPSAVSLQIKRLEEIARAPLFYRDRRKLSLTTAGELLEGYARRILGLNAEVLDLLAGERAIGPLRLGMVEDFARTLLAGALRRFSNLNPDVQLEIKVCGSLELRELIAANRLDLALCFAVPSDEDAVASRSVYWFGEYELAARDVLPLALLERPCLFRAQALAALDAANQPYEIAVETASISALQAAISAGLGVTSRTAGFMSAAHNAMRLPGLPTLPPMGYSILQASKAPKSVVSLRGILLGSLNEL